MTNLIKSEMKKIFHKKSFYIVTIIFVLYAILTNVIYKSIDDFSINDPEVTIEELEKENSRLDLNVKENLDKYVTNLSNIEIKKMEDTYKNGEYLINKYVFPLVYQANLLEYMEKDLEESNIVRTKIDEYLNKIKDNDWKYFASMRMSELKNISNEDKDEKTDIYIKLTEYRIKNNIPYDEDNYLNNALIDVENNLSEYYNLKNKKTSKEEQERLDYLKEEMLVNKYILEHQKDIKNNESLKGVLSNFASEFGLFILIYVIMLSGSIVSEEYNKGTIKNLLTKPFKRRTILTSKLLTVLILMPIIILIMVLIEIIVGGLILGFDSLNIPILIYNSSTSLLEVYNVFKYLILSLISNIPIYLVLGIICFMLSTITASTSAAITITFLFYLMSNVISNLALVYNLKIFKYFVALHWDFSYLLESTPNPYHFTPSFSLIIIGIYLIVILALTYIFFDKKDVKNI